MAADMIVVPKHDSKFNKESCGCVKGLSHDQLIEMMRAAGYFRKNEVVSGLKITEHSTSFYLETVDK